MSEENIIKMLNNFPQIETVKYILEIQEENKVLKKTLENNSKINVADHKYASEMEDKYLTEHNILTEFEKWLEEEINIIENTYSQINGNYMRMQPVLDTFKKCEDRLQELKGDDK